MIDPALALLIVLGIAALLAFAGAHKLKDLALFAEIFAAYRVLPESAARRVARVVPCVEIGIAAALLWPASRAWAIAAAIGIFAAYASALALNLARNRRDLDCGCAGPGSRRAIASWMVWRNFMLAACIGFAAVPRIVRPMSGVDFLTIAGGLAAVIVLYEAMDRLLGDIAPRAAALRDAP